jgi:hypothetical protein
VPLIQEILGLNVSLNEIKKLLGNFPLTIPASYNIYPAPLMVLLFILISNPTLVAEEVSKLTSISVSTIRRVSRGTGHSWLQDKYPNEYTQLINLAEVRKSNAATAAKNSRLVSGVFPPIISPEGITYIVTCLREFAREYNLERKCLAKLLRGSAKTHKGWKLA